MVSTFVWFAGLVAVAGPTTSAGGAGRDAPVVRIERRQDDACPTGDLPGDIGRLSGGHVRVDPAAEARAAIAVTRTEDGLLLVLEIEHRGNLEHRQVPVETCDIALRAAALVVAVTLAPLGTSEEVLERDLPTIPEPAAIDRPRTASEPRPSTARVDSSTPDSVPRVRTDSLLPRSRPWRFAVWTGFVAATLPRLAAVLGFDLSRRVGPIRLRVGGWHSFARERVLEPGVGIRAQLSGGEVGVAAPLAVGPVAVELGGALMIAAMVGTGTGDRVRPLRAVSPWVVGSAGAGVGWPAQGRAGVLLRGEASIVLARPTIDLDSPEGPRNAFEAPPVGGRVIGGPWVRFP